jgi:hypothetical protein
MAWKLDLKQVAESPKSTVVGLCVLALAAERGVHFDASGHLAMSARDWFDVGCGVLTAAVSGLSQDAGRVKAHVPGAVETEMVPSHEEPDDPSAVVIVRK